MLNLTEAGRRIGKSRTTVKRLIDEGKIAASIDPANGYPVVSESEVQRYLSSFPPYIPTHKPQLSQPSPTASDLR